MKITELVKTSCLVGLLCFSTAAARAMSLTPVQVNSKEPSLISILDGIYGQGNYLRISDDLDGIWEAREIAGVIAIGSVSAAAQRLGVCEVCDGSDSVVLGPKVTPNGILPITLLDSVFTFNGPVFRWFDAAAGDPAVGTVYSDPLLNSGNTDHMVSFAITNRPGVYVLAFEDWLSSYQAAPSDRDFNDFIVEVRMQPMDDLTSVPEPGTVALLGGALLMLGLSQRFSWRRK